MLKPRANVETTMSNLLSPVITGLGAVAPLGVGVPAFVAGLRAGRSGVRPLDFEHPRMKSRVAAGVPASVFDPRSVLDEADIARLPKLVPMALAAAREALGTAGLMIEGDLETSRRVGLILGTGGGGIDFTLDQYAAAYSGKNASLWTITNATHGNLAGELSIRLGLRGPSWCVSTGCASSSDALGLAMQTLRAQNPESPTALEAMVVIGADAHVRWETLYAMELLKVITARDPALAGEEAASASRPFDATRDGFVLGEGAWAVVLERADAARRRATRVLGSALGYAATCDAFHRVRPDPDMIESARAMTLALDDAGLKPDDVVLAHYHGTSTRLNDAAETRAVKRAFGPHAERLIGHSIKGAIGHPQGACGLAAVVATLGALGNADAGPAAFAPPTINLRTPDPECDLDYTPNHARRLDGTAGVVALVNCLAFGAKNSALVLRGP